MKPLPLSAAGSVDEGAVVYTTGYPGTADDINSQSGITNVRTINQRTYEASYEIPYPAGPEDSTLTSGVVSRFTQFSDAENTWVIQHTAHVNHGNSGGPLLLANGSVVGINTYIMGGTNDLAEYNLSIFIEYPEAQLKNLEINFIIYHDWSVLILPGIVAGVLAACILFYVIYTKRKPAVKWKPEPGMYRLQCVSGVFAPKRFRIQNPTRIGRDPGRNDLVYPPNASKISGVHCQLMFDNNQLYLEDLNSKNGTYRDGIKIPVMAKVPVEVGSTFSLGDSTELFRIEVTAKK